MNLKKILVPNNSEKTLSIFFLLLRLTLGVIFIREGTKKLLTGEEELIWVGSQLALFGIDFWPLLFGYIAAFTEAVGGACILLGLFVRPAALGLSFVMLVAVSYHINNGDSFGFIAYPFLCFICFTGLILIGGLRFSLDHFISKISKK